MSEVAAGDKCDRSSANGEQGEIDGWRPHRCAGWPDQPIEHSAENIGGNRALGANRSDGPVKRGAPGSGADHGWQGIERF